MKATPAPDDSTIARSEQVTGGAQSDPSVERLGHYRLIELLGRGGQGAVYLAEDDLATVSRDLGNSERAAELAAELESLGDQEGR